MLVGTPCARNANHGNVQMSASDQVVKGGENLLVSKIAHGSEEHKCVGLLPITKGSTGLSQVRHRSPSRTGQEQFERPVPHQQIKNSWDGMRKMANPHS